MGTCSSQDPKAEVKNEAARKEEAEPEIGKEDAEVPQEPLPQLSQKSHKSEKSGMSVREEDRMPKPALPPGPQHQHGSLVWCAGYRL